MVPNFVTIVYKEHDYGAGDRVFASDINYKPSVVVINSLV